MSILLALSLPEMSVLIAGMLISLIVIWRWRMMEPRRVMGPQRLDASDPPASVLLAGLVGYLTMIAVGIALAVLFVRSSAAATQPMNPGPAVVYIAIAAQAAGLLALGAMLSNLSRGIVSRLGLDIASLQTSLLPAMVAAAAAIPLTFLVAWLVEVIFRQLGYEQPLIHGLLQLAKDHPSMMPWIALSAIVAAPMFEEVVFRGCLQTGLAGMLARAGVGEVQSRWSGIAVASLLFVLVHGQFWMMPPLFVLSVFLGYAYERTGKLWVPILMHMAFNGISIVNFLMVSGTN